MGRPRFTRAVRDDVYAKTDGVCFHCGEALAGNWDVDHFPVVYRDIEDQCYCWPCGTVVDPLLVENLQPSCCTCNRSHRFERGRWWLCGHTQLRIRKMWIKLCFAAGLVWVCGFLVGRFMG